MEFFAIQPQSFHVNSLLLSNASFLSSIYIYSSYCIYVLLGDHIIENLSIISLILFLKHIIIYVEMQGLVHMTLVAVLLDRLAYIFSMPDLLDIKCHPIYIFSRLSTRS